MDARKHRVVGVLAGGGIALGTRSAENGLELLIEMLAGMSGGALGAKFPDWAEPAVSSWHRGPVHSVTAASTTAVAATNGIAQLNQTVQQRITGLRLAKQQARTLEEQQQYTLEILFWLALVAFCKGAAVGYLSHVAMDATTPRGIPLLGIGN